MLFQKSWTISSPSDRSKGSGASHRVNRESTPLRDSLYTFPDICRGLARDCLTFIERVPPNSPDLQHPLLDEGPKIPGMRSTTELPRQIFKMLPHNKQKRMFLQYAHAIPR